MTPLDKAFESLSTSDIVEAYFQGTEEIHNYVVSVIHPVLLGQIGLNDKQTAMVGTYYRIVGWLKAIVELNSLPHYQAVASAARSLFELLLDLKLLQTDVVNDSATKFHAFPDIEKFRAASKLVDYCDGTNNNKLECSNQRNFINVVTNIKNIESTILKLWGVNKKGKPNWPTHWSGLSIAERAAKLGPDYEEMYIEFYPFLSWHIHSGSTGYSGIVSDVLEKAFGLMHKIMQKVVLDATQVVAEEMKLDKIDNLIFDFSSTITELRNATNRIILEKYDPLKK